MGQNKELCEVITSRTTCVYRKPRSGATIGNATTTLYKITIKYRDVAQMVARHVRDVDAAGSTPVISTTAEKVPFRVPFLLCIENKESNR